MLDFGLNKVVLTSVQICILQLKIFYFKSKKDYAIHEEKTEILISCAVTAYELHCEKMGLLPMRKQRHRSTVQ